MLARGQDLPWVHHVFKYHTVLEARGPDERPERVHMVRRSVQ